MRKIFFVAWYLGISAEKRNSFDKIFRFLVKTRKNYSVKESYRLHDAVDIVIAVFSFRQYVEAQIYFCRRVDYYLLHIFSDFYLMILKTKFLRIFIAVCGQSSWQQ